MAEQRDQLRQYRNDDAEADRVDQHGGEDDRNGRVGEARHGQGLCHGLRGWDRG